MTKPTVSACIISYNQEAYIDATISGARKQLLDASYEIVIADDDSTDGTRAIAEKHAAEDSRIHVLPRTQNLGMLRNWVSAIKACQGEFIALCEGDDFWTDERKLQIQLDVLREQPTYSGCFTDAALLQENNIFLKHATYLKENNVDTSTFRAFSDELYRRNPVPTCTLMFRNRPNIDFGKFYLASPYADWFLHVFNLQYGDYAMIPAVTASYRLHDAGVYGQSSQLKRVNDKILCTYLLWKTHRSNKRITENLISTHVSLLADKVEKLRSTDKRPRAFLLRLTRILSLIFRTATFGKLAARL